MIQCEKRSECEGQISVCKHRFRTQNIRVMFRKVERKIRRDTLARIVFNDSV
jgi:hypothetical protein